MLVFINRLRNYRKTNLGITSYTVTPIVTPMHWNVLHTAITDYNTVTPLSQNVPTSAHTPTRMFGILHRIRPLSIPQQTPRPLSLTPPSQPGPHSWDCGGIDSL